MCTRYRTGRKSNHFSGIDIQFYSGYDSFLKYSMIISHSVFCNEDSKIIVQVDVQLSKDEQDPHCPQWFEEKLSLCYCKSVFNCDI